MRPLYESIQDDLEIYNSKSSHFSPHLHSFIECVYITDGTLELGIGQELYHMEKGDFAVIFPGLIHHAQVFDPGKCHSMYMLASPSYAGSFRTMLTTQQPSNPIIRAKDVHPDIIYALNGLLEGSRKITARRSVASGTAQEQMERLAAAPVIRQGHTGAIHPVNQEIANHPSKAGAAAATAHTAAAETRSVHTGGASVQMSASAPSANITGRISQLPEMDDQLHPEIPALKQAFVQMILARALLHYTLVDRSVIKDDDLIYQTVAYVAEHFTEPITLTSMAKDLYVSPYSLSRIFSGTFHTNFNGYVNDTRLEYVCSLLRYSDQSITEAYENAGFESQRTFNRVFSDKLHMTPREYRNAFRETAAGDNKETAGHGYYHI